MYKTKQMQLLLDYLESKVDGHFTASDLFVYFKEQQQNIGMATIYRHLDKLIAQGLVLKFVTQGNQSSCFEYIGGHHCGHCYHCKCKQCGELFHVRSSYFEKLQQDLKAQYNLLIDFSSTTLMAICPNCQGANHV